MTVMLMTGRFEPSKTVLRSDNLNTLSEAGGFTYLVWSDVGCHCRGTELLGGVLRIQQSGSFLTCTSVRKMAPVRRWRKTRPRNRVACYYGAVSCEDVYAVGRIANR